jgi:hypothetical protein
MSTFLADRSAVIALGTAAHAAGYDNATIAALIRRYILRNYPYAAKSRKIYRQLWVRIVVDALIPADSDTSDKDA